MSLKIISTFGDHTSLLPLAVKDGVNSLGMTAFSYDAGGEIEAKDRFIDEFGTQAIWLGGLPFFKWAYDKTAYKAAGLNSKIDMRLVADKDQFEIASKYAKKYAEKLKDTKIIDTLADAGKNSKKFQNLFLGRFAVATALTLGSFFTLVKVKQNYTEKQIEKRFWEEKAKKAKDSFYKSNVGNSPAFKGFGVQNNSHGDSIKMKKNSPQNSPSFKGAGRFMQSFMFDPVKNLFIVDAGITGERLGSARTKTEFMEYAIKEGSLLMFMYVAGRYVQSGIEALSEKFLKKPIQLHAEVIASDSLKDSIKSGKILKDVEAFEKIAVDNNAIYEFVYAEKNANNIIIDAAKKSGILESLKNRAKNDTGLVNPHKYIDPKRMKELSANLKKFAESFTNMKEHSKDLGKPAETLEQFLKKSKKLKIGSVVGNIGLSCVVLGLIVPYVMLKYREKTNGNKDFHVQTEIQQRLENNFKARQTA